MLEQGQQSEYDMAAIRRRRWFHDEFSPGGSDDFVYGVAHGMHVCSCMWRRIAYDIFTPSSPVG